MGNRVFHVITATLCGWCAVDGLIHDTQPKPGYVYAMLAFTYFTLARLEK